MRGIIYEQKNKIYVLDYLLHFFYQCNNTPASIAAGKYFERFQYIHSKKKVKKKAINARYNNKVISTKIPGYIEGSTSMYSAYWIFGHCSSLGTKYSYSSSKKRVTLQRNSQKLVMTLNSRTATLNGKKFTLPSAPRKIRYIAKKKIISWFPEISLQKTRLKLFMEQSSVIRSDLKGQYC